uniref:Uncharacterized protein n=1 Tax=Romanomermis culicivorax TaxID=13658 RepID=A0A915HTV2_ROMCU
MFIKSFHLKNYQFNEKCVCAKMDRKNKVTIFTWPKRESSAAAPIDHHTGQTRYVHFFVVVEKDHSNGAHAGRVAAGPYVGPRIGLLLDYVRVRVTLQMQEGTFAGAIIGHVLFGCYDPVPAEAFKINLKRVSATPGFVVPLVTIHAGRVTLVAIPIVIFHSNFELEMKEKRIKDVRTLIDLL